MGIGRKARDSHRLGEVHDQGDAKWIVIRGQLRGPNDTPFGRPTPSQPIGRPLVGRPQGVIGVSSLLLISNIIFLTSSP
jgi:hypothetical protein